ncbi:MAG: 4'-phosphopantetheinyl transferase superfamily protein [Kordiimonadaceae bacterium]|nr:4'-phosphopantetheinyl transferase superfamily protein [Kordiimonadaceae bacterium]MBO6569529.1 4'-phosphopantetheinyl transferase superfamily protein [Kordiimonadaceae bacterium]MBO6965004.1 4'-phosphopantetheinyl transferase superfamily protein [Kordiimonadaceae bacterium]
MSELPKVPFTVRAADPQLSRQDVLSDTEHDRLAGMHEGARPAFVTARTMLRTKLANIMGLTPAAVPLYQEGAGRISIEGFSPTEPPFFSVSHTGAAEAGIAAVATSEHTPIGIDIQQIDHVIDWRRVAERRFPQHEWQLMSAMPEGEGRMLFFTLWAIKEACVKLEDGALMPYLRGIEIDLSSGRFDLLSPTPGGLANIHVFFNYVPEFELVLACVSRDPAAVKLDCHIEPPAPKADSLNNPGTD